MEVRRRRADMMGVWSRVRGLGIGGWGGVRTERYDGSDGAGIGSEPLVDSVGIQ